MSLTAASDIPCSSATAAVRAGIDRDTAFGAVTPPIVLSSNFSFDGFGNKRQYDYTRSGNPTRDLLGEALRRRPELKIQASGGVATLADLIAARDLGCDGAIVGRAIYEGRFTVAEALKAVAS